MPAEYTIDKLSGVVFSFAHGNVTDQDAYSHQDRLRKDPDFDPGFCQLFDYTKVTQVDLSSDAIHHLAERNPFGLGSCRAFVVPSDLLYGLSRMFQILTDHHPDELSVFRDMQEARKYLSLDEEALEFKT
jgi:hypothetical protein